MKKFGKILSSVLAASMLISAFAMNAMAASKAHTVTIKADKTEGLVAGDTVTIELVMDNTEALVQCGYKLSFDSTAFTADTTKVSRLEKCIDKTWLDGMKDPDGDWAYYLGNPTYKISADNFNFQWAGAEGVEAEYAVDNRVIGKFYLTVADGAADGEYTFSLSEAITMDAGENSTAAMVSEPLTVTVGEPAPTTVNNYFSANFTAGGEKYNANKGMTFFFNSKAANKDAEYTWSFADMFGETVFEAETDVTVEVEVANAPAADDVTLKGYAWAE